MLKSIRARLLSAFLLPALLLLGGAGAVGYVAVRRMMERELGRALSQVASAASSQVNGARMLTIEPGDDQPDAETRTWRNLHRTLTEVKDATGVRRLVAFDAQGRVRVDAGGGLPTGAEMPELARDRLELQRVFEKGERAESQVLFEGSDGRLYKTGYAPIRDDAGAVVGGVAVEGSAEFWRPFTNLAAGYAAFVVVTLLALFAAAMAMALLITRPLVRLVRAAVRIGQGDLSTPVPPDNSQEIGALARELETMRQALESRDRQLKMMLAGVAHEVRNPIGGIELFAGILEEELPSSASEPREHVQRIRREIDYLKRIVEDFLAFAREQKLSVVAFDASTLVQTASDLLAGDAQARQVKVHVEAEPAQVEGDQNLLTAAVVNLLKNAVQASPEGAEVSVRGGREANAYTVRVEDRGAGIPAEVQERIFEPFFTTREKGTGLGLPLAQKIVQAHRGELTVQSAPGKTVFQIRLPLPPRAPS